MNELVAWGERRQVPLYAAAILLGGVVGLFVPAAAALEGAITPVLGLLLYATFLAVPFRSLGRAMKDGRFLAAVLLLNFLLVPVVVFAVSRFVADREAVLVGVLLVLLAPCVDYVLVFAGLAGGARERLLSATPLLMFAQIVLLPAYLWLMAGPDVVAAFDLRPFAEAFLLLIALPLALAALTQSFASRARAGRTIQRVMTASTVPLMMLTLGIVVASQISHLGGSWGQVLAVIPLYIVFIVVIAPLGVVVAGAAGLDIAGIRAVSFSGVTRNSLVVLPLALALPPAFAVTPLVVVTQTLVELVAMVVMVALMPRLVVRRR